MSTQEIKCQSIALLLAQRSSFSSYYWQICVGEINLSVCNLAETNVTILVFRNEKMADRQNHCLLQNIQQK